MDISLIILVMICFWVQTGKTTSAVCKQRNQVTINKHLGSTFHFQCRKDSHKGEKYKYIHYNQTTDKPDLVNVASKHTQRLLSFEDGGDYCCSDQHAHGGMISSTTPECCITIAILPVIQWELPKAVALNGGAITGSCSASGYPRPNVRVIIPAGCDYQQNNVHVGNYTNKAMFTMNVTKHCEQIYCLISSKTYSVSRTNKLLIVENVSCGGHRGSRSIPVAIKTPISKEHSLIRTRNIDNDHNAVTYARGNGANTTTCSIIMIITMTLFLLTLFLY